MRAAGGPLLTYLTIVMLAIFVDSDNDSCLDFCLETYNGKITGVACEMSKNDEEVYQTLKSIALHTPIYTIPKFISSLKGVLVAKSAVVTAGPGTTVRAKIKSDNAEVEAEGAFPVFDFVNLGEKIKLMHGNTNTTPLSDIFDPRRSKDHLGFSDEDEVESVSESEDYDEDDNGGGNGTDTDELAQEDPDVVESNLDYDHDDNEGLTPWQAKEEISPRPEMRRKVLLFSKAQREIDFYPMGNSIFPLPLSKTYYGNVKKRKFAGVTKKYRKKMKTLGLNVARAQEYSPSLR